MTEHTDQIVETVRAGDPDRYVSVLYAPEDKRAALFALHAFDIEVARIRDLVSEPLTGEIRLQWWRDTIAAGAVTGHPVADALVQTIHAHSLPTRAFDNLLEARLFDLYDDPMPDRATLEGYCGETQSALIQLVSLVLDPVAARACADLAGHAGCALGIASLLRLLPRHRARGQCYLPADLLAAAGADRDTLLSNDPGEGGRRAVAAMAALGREHLAAFKARASELPSSLRPAFLPAAVAGAWLDAVERAPMTGGRAPSVLRRHWLLFRRAIRGW